MGSNPRIAQTQCVPLVIISALLLPMAASDLGLLSWGALNPLNKTAAGNTLYAGDGTYYGQQMNQDSAGACSYGANKSDTLDLPWTSGILNTIALNADQFQEGLACGMCAYYRGTGGGIGTTPISTDWQLAFVDNLCPECAFGSIDLDANGNGRWNVEWFPAPCEVGDSTFLYVNSADLSNPYWFQFTISNTRVPVQKVEMNSNGIWGEMRRTYNNMYAANGGPFNSWPIPLRITSVLNDTVYDMLPSKAGGQGFAQFPDRGLATFPQEGFIAQTINGLRAAAIPASAIPETILTPSTSASMSLAAHESPAPAPAMQSFPTTVLLPRVNDSALATTSFTVLDNGQCGGLGFYCNGGQCKDAIWDQSLCNPGHICQRNNASWWSCLPAVTTPPQTSLAGDGSRSLIFPASGGNQSSTTSITTLGSNTSMVMLGWQCGGVGCKSNISNSCSDQKWQDVNCYANLTCTRFNASWWGCTNSNLTAISSPSSQPTGVAGAQLPGTYASILPPTADSFSPVPATPSMNLSVISSELSNLGGLYPVVARGQCGGTTSYCATLSGPQCKDGNWDGAQCPAGYACQRYNAGWWQCDPTQSKASAVAATSGRRLSGTSNAQ